ncbi:unnamed protein product [Sphagnum balticum]
MVDADVLSLLAYFQSHPQNSSRRKFEECEKELRRYLEAQKKEQKTVISEREKVKAAVYRSVEMNQALTGIETCGYPDSYTKGINLILQAFGK